MRAHEPCLKTEAPPWQGGPSKSDEPEATDGALPYTAEQLRKMDPAFRAAMAKAIESGSERDRERAMTAPALRIVVTETGVIGQLLNRGLSGTEAFHIDDRSLGVFATADEAAAAVMNGGGNA
jgi:hypothetical protein